MSNGVLTPITTDPLTHAPNVETPAATELPQVKAAKLGGVDWLRILAIAGVAYYHAADPDVHWYVNAPGAQYAFAGLHALTAASTYFACVSRSAASDREIITKRASRLLIPWLAFSLPHMLSAVRSHKFRMSMLWVGGATHLWFLPFIFIVGCAVAMLARRGLIVRSVGSAVGWAIASILAMAIEPYLGTSLKSMTEPIWQVVNAIPSALMGIAIYAMPKRTGDVPLLSAFAGAGAAVWLTMPSNIELQSWPMAAACGAVLFGLARVLPIRSTPASAFVGRASFGVYLMHMIVLMAVVKGISRLTHVAPDRLASDVGNLMILGQVALAIVLSLAIVAILERTPLRRLIGA